MKAIDLRIEYLKNPMGIDITTPRFFWNCIDGITQTAYEISASDDQGKVMWETGKILSEKMAHIPYEGKFLQSRDRVLWKVRLWDENDQAGEWSETAVFEMGLLHASDWTAEWITGNYIPQKDKRYPVDCFRKLFDIPQNVTVKKARLYAAACGIYEARMNGKKAGDAVLAPGITDYRKRIQYQTIDVTELLCKGENELTLELADGWYRGSVGAWAMKNYYGTETKIIAQLEITDENGKRTVINSDGTFQWSCDGPIRFADNKDGEIVDASKVPLYAGYAKIAEEKAVVPTASNNNPITEHERLMPKMITTPSGKMVLDFGQNIAGYVEFTVHAKEGQRIFLRYGEMLDEEGEFTQKNIQCVNKKITTPLQQVEYFCKTGENHYKTKFAIFGFQYVLVETDVDIVPEDFTAIAVYTDMEQRTRFDSSNELLNKFVQNTLWSAKNNSADLPTDCPTRERHGWTGDAQIFFNSAAYLLDYASFAKKFEKDMTDWQTPDGMFPQIAPEGGTDPYMRVMNGSSGWADAGVMIPYRFWKIYGDRQILEENYEAMKKYAGFVESRLGKNALLAKRHHVRDELGRYIVNTGQAYGEWAEPEDVHAMKWTDFTLPPTEVSTAYAAYIMRLMKEIADELGHERDKDHYSHLEKMITKAYQEMSRRKQFTLNTDRQARLVRPLYFHLLSKKETAYAQKRLIEALENYGWRLGTGFLSTPLILDVLSAYDLDAAYRILENEQMPGWLYMPKVGANTIWESWEGAKAKGDVASLDHYSKGACCEWVFKEMCGIHVDGENHFMIAPLPGGHFTHAKTEYKSVYGTVSCGWKKTEENDNGHMYEFEIRIPANCTAEICIPGQKAVTVKAGVYRF